MLSVTDFQVARALDNRSDTTDAECVTVDEIIDAWQENREPRKGAIEALYVICRRLAINVY